MSKMTPAKLQEIEELAKKATPGPWLNDPGSIFVDAENRVEICDTHQADEAGFANAAFIAALDPSTALALVQMAREAEGIAKLEKERNEHAVALAFAGRELQFGVKSDGSPADWTKHIAKLSRVVEAAKELQYAVYKFCDWGEGTRVDTASTKLDEALAALEEP